MLFRQLPALHAGLRHKPLRGARQCPARRRTASSRATRGPTASRVPSSCHRASDLRARFAVPFGNMIHRVLGHAPPGRQFAADNETMPAGPSRTAWLRESLAEADLSAAFALDQRTITGIGAEDVFLRQGSHAGTGCSVQQVGHILVRGNGMVKSPPSVSVVPTMTRPSQGIRKSRRPSSVSGRTMALSRHGELFAGEDQMDALGRLRR